MCSTEMLFIFVPDHSWHITIKNTDYNIWQWQTPTPVTVEHYIVYGKERIFSEINNLKYILKLLHILNGKIQIYNRL